MRPVALPASQRVQWPSAGTASLHSASIIVDGDYPFDKETLEKSGVLPVTPHAVIYCNELPGTNQIERGMALLEEIRRRKASGEFSNATPTLVFLHGANLNGELMLGDGDRRLLVPGTVLIHELSKEPQTAGAPRMAAPIVLSGCHAVIDAPSLMRSRRMIIINGSEEPLMAEDAEAMLKAGVQIAERSWVQGTVPEAAQWFDELGRVSGETLHLVGQGEWISHDPLNSCDSLEEISDAQAALVLQKRMAMGTVDELAEALLLFGTGPLLQVGTGSPPVMHHLMDECTQDFKEKIVLLVASGIPIDQVDASGRTVLHRACMHATGPFHPDEPHATKKGRQLVRLLLANDASPDVKNRQGVTPRALAMASGDVQLIASFHPEVAASDYPKIGPAGLRTVAEKEGWKSVLSLLENMDSAMETDPEGQEELSSSSMSTSTGDAPRLPLTEAELIAASAMMALDTGVEDTMSNY